MRIGMIAQTYLPLLGGAEIHVANLSKFLKRAGHDVKIFTNTMCHDKHDDIGIAIERHQFSQGFIGMYKMYQKINDFTKDVDLIHSHYSHRLSALAGIISKHKKIPLIITLHGLGILDRPYLSLKPKIIHYFFRYISLKLSDMILATSKELASIAKRYVPPEKVRIIPNAVDTEYFSPSHISESKIDDDIKNKIIIMTVRRLVPKNGVQYLIESIPYIIEKNNNVIFYYIGDGRMREYLVKRVHNLGVQSYVKFLGDIPNNKVKDYLNIASLVVFPSTAESTSIACLEAMSMKKPIVASYVGAYPYLLGNNERGILVKLFDSPASKYDAPLMLEKKRIKKLADAILMLIDDIQLRKKLGENGRCFVKQNHDWRIVSQKIIKIYDELLEKW